MVKTKTKVCCLHRFVRHLIETLRADFLVIFILISQVILMAADPSSALSAEKPLAIVADEWCPFNCSKESLDQGFVIDMARDILASERYAVTYDTLTWMNAVDGVREGRFDAIVGASRDEAKGLVLVEEPLGENKNCFYTRIDDPFIYRAKTNLTTRRLAVVSGYLYGPVLDDYIASKRSNFRLVQIATGAHPLLTNIKKLQARRIDTLVENMHVMDYSLKKYRLSGIRLAGCEESSPIYMAISPKRQDSEKIASSLAEGIRKLRKSGKLREILARYGLSDWK